MADRIIKVLATGNIVAYGLSKLTSRTVLFEAADTDQSTVKIAYERWLDGETLSSVAVTPSALTGSAVTVSPIATLTLSAVAWCGDIEVLATSSAGRKHTLWINVQQVDRASASLSPDYCA